MELATARLRLRDFVAGDLPAFAAYHADPRYREHYAPDEIDPIPLLDMFRRWAAESPRRNYQLAIVRDGTLIGCGGVRTRGLPPGRADLGMELAPRSWGVGYATEAARALLSLATELGAREIRATTAPANARAARLLRRLAFERVGESEWRLLQ